MADEYVAVAGAGGVTSQNNALNKGLGVALQDRLAAGDMDRNPPAACYESYNLLAGQRMTTAGKSNQDVPVPFNLDPPVPFLATDQPEESPQCPLSSLTAAVEFFGR